ncbi:ParB/RepB/Spo0J family partition protein [Streptomyces sp. NPDC020412]|uniref:ParB/RepB/Spo0J family partition protein n=1 Tax=Streptomyces sp. NPDC020412 TaxID=3365073 RepID=UPI00379C8B68
MSERRRGLGRGLAALIPAAPQEKPVPTGSGGSPSGASPVQTVDRGVTTPTSLKLPSAAPVPDSVVVPEPEPDTAAELLTPVGAFFAEVPLDSISRNPFQPRKVFDEDDLAELVVSIKEVGLLQPVVVRQTEPEQYELIMGERRVRACREAGLETIPAIVRHTDDEKLLLDALLENLHRVQLNPLEEAFAYDQLLKDFSCTHDQLADRIGRSRPQVSNTLRLLRLTPAVQQKVAAGVLMAGHARALLGVEDPQTQEELARRIVAEGLSVRSVEEIVKLYESEDKGSAKQKKGPRAGARVSPALTDLASRLSDRFETRVKVDLGQKKGKIVVEFASMEDLERILGTLAPGEDRALEKGLTGAGEGGED